MDTLTITETYETLSQQGVPHWVVVMTDQNGGLHKHAFPKDTLAWRAAEYGIDPADVDTLLELVLYEQETAKAGPPPVLTASTVDEARTAQLARIADAKKRRAIVGLRAPRASRGADPLAAVRNHRHHPDRLAEISEAVARTAPAHGGSPSRPADLRARDAYRAPLPGYPKEID